MKTQRWTLAVVSIATAMLMLDIAVVNTALPRIGEDLDAGLSGLQWVVDAYTLALATTVLTAGALADRLGRRRVFAVGLVVFTVSSLVAAMAGSIEMLNTARAVQGVGGAILFAVSLALLANAYPGQKERTGALAVYGATIGASFAVGPLVGGLLTSGIDWQWVFLVNIPIGIYALWITLTRVEESRDPHPRRIDWPGQITLTAGLGLLVLGLLRGNEDGWTSTPIVAELSGAVLLLAAFLVIESRVREPMLPLDADHKWTPDQVLTGDELRAIIDAVHPLEELPREPSATARVFRFRDGTGEIGFINPVSEPFCSDCNRVRVTADGKLRTCLFSVNETDLRLPLRSGTSDDEIADLIRNAVWRKELKHHVGEKGFRQPPRTMSAIGG